MTITKLSGQLYRKPELCHWFDHMKTMAGRSAYNVVRPVNSALLVLLGPTDTNSILIRLSCQTGFTIYTGKMGCICNICEPLLFGYAIQNARGTMQQNLRSEGLVKCQPDPVHASRALKRVHAIHKNEEVHRVTLPRRSCRNEQQQGSLIWKAYFTLRQRLDTAPLRETCATRGCTCGYLVAS